MGRPSSYTQEQADEIVRRLGAGETLVAICKDERMPAARTVADWRRDHPDFAKSYDDAMLAGCHVLLDETVEIADKVKEDPASRRVRIWARHELVKRKRPDVFGDRVTLAGDRNAPVQVESSVTIGPGEAYLRMLNGTGNGG